VAADWRQPTNQDGYPEPPAPHYDSFVALGWRFRQIMFVTPAQPLLNEFKAGVFPLREH